MDKIIKVHDEDLDAVVQPGVGWEDLNHELGKEGLWFPVDPVQALNLEEWLVRDVVVPMQDDMEL
jgi:hypothetical protein